VADVIPPDAGAITDVAALLRYAAANGFFLAAVWGLARTAVSPYSRLRSRIGVTASPSACHIAIRPCIAATEASGNSPVQSPAA